MIRFLYLITFFYDKTARLEMEWNKFNARCYSLHLFSLGRKLIKKEGNINTNTNPFYRDVALAVVMSENIMM